MTVAVISCVKEAKILQHFVVLLGFVMMADIAQMQPKPLVFQTVYIALMVIIQI
jgi:hypothetical protein